MKKLQILGTGCSKCKKLLEITEQVAKSLNIEYELIKVTDMNEIMNFGIMMTPALVIDGNVKVVGRVPNAEELEEFISEKRED